MKTICIAFNPIDQTFEIKKKFNGCRSVLQILKNITTQIEIISKLEDGNLSVQGVFSESRKRENACVRQIIMFLFWEYCVSKKRHAFFQKGKRAMSGRVVAGIIAYRDHSTLSHVRKKFTQSEEERKAGKDFKDFSIFDLFVVKYEQRFRECFEQELEKEMNSYDACIEDVTVGDLRDLLIQNNIDLSQMCITEPFKQYLEKAHGCP